MTERRRTNEVLPTAPMKKDDAAEAPPPGPAPAKPPRGLPVLRCPYWRGIGCVSCYRELMRAPAGGR